MKMADFYNYKFVKRMQSFLFFSVRFLGIFVLLWVTATTAEAELSFSTQTIANFGTGQTRSVQVVSNHAYVCSSDKFESWDVTDINNPALLDSVSDIYGTDLVVSGNYAYIVIGMAGLKVINISDPSNLGDPVQVVSANSGMFYGVSISGTKAFLVGYSYNDNGGLLEVFNITNPASPSSLGTYTESGDSGYYDVEVKGDYAYVAVGNKGLKVLDISTAVITEVWNTGESFDAYFDAYDIEIEGNMAYLAAQYNGLKIYDLTDPENPVLKTTYKPTTDDYYLYALKVVEDRVYARGNSYDYSSGNSTGRLDTIDVSDPANPVLSSMETVGGADGTFTEQGVDVSGNLVYTTGSSGISVIAVQTLKAMESTAFSFEVPLLDASSYTWALDSTGTELGMVVDEAGKVTYADPANAHVGFHTFNVTATAGDTSQQTFAYDIWVENLNQTPEITNTNLSVTWYRDIPNMYQISANDSDLQAPGYTEKLIYSLDAESIALGATVDASGLVIWKPTKAQIGQHVLVLTVTDAKGAKASKNLSVAVATPGIEFESNDTIDEAADSSLIPGKTSKGDLSDTGKIDYYTFTLDQNKLIELSLITQGTADYKVELLSSEAALTIDDILSDEKGLASFSAWYETDFSTVLTENDIFNGQFKIKDNLLLTWGNGQFGDLWSNGLKIYELGSSLKYLGQVIYAEDYWSDPIINGTRIYLSGNNRKGAVDFTNPNNPAYLGSINEGEERNVWDAQGDYIFAAKGWQSDKVYIYKIGSNAIQEVSSITLDKATEINQIKTGGGLLFVRTNFWEDPWSEDCGTYLNVFDISTPETPVFIRKLKDFQELRNVTNNYVWACNGNTVNLYQIMALKNNENPVPISSLTLDHYVNTIYGESPFFFAKGDNQFSTILINQNGNMKLLSTETGKGYLKGGSFANGSAITMNQEWFDYNGTSLTSYSLKIGDSAWVYESFSVKSGITTGEWVWDENQTGSIASGHTRVGLKPGTYYVRVTPDGDEDSNQVYGLRYDDLGGYNDPGQSFDLFFGTTYENSIYTLLDEDIFNFSFAGPTFFEFSFDNSSADSDYILSLLNNDEKIIDQFNLLAGEDVFAGINLFEDTYQFIIENFTVVDAAESYTFTATKEDAIQPLLEMEPNDSEENAMPLVLDEKVSGYISGNEDADMYRLSLNVSKAMDIVFSSLSGSGSYLLTLEIGGKVIDQIQVDAFSMETLPLALFPGNYILRVTGNGVDSSDPYTIELKEVADADREFEPNNGTKFANGIDNGDLKDGRLYGSGDLDFYGMSVDQSALVEFKLIPYDTQANFSVTISNAAGTQIASFTANQTAKYKEVGCKAGKFYICVTGTNLDTGLYTIQVNGEVAGIKELLSVSLLSLAGEQSLQIEKEASQTLVLYGSFSDGSVADLSDQASWVSTDQNVAEVLQGTITAKAAGNATITASYGGKTGKATIVVSDPEAGQKASASKQGYGNLIILAGGGVLETNHLKDTTQQLCDLFYMKFKGRGFDDADIFYLNPVQYKDLDGNGFDDQIVDTTSVTVYQFLSAITGWAKNYDSDGPLYIYLNDHGANDQFQINVGQILTAAAFHSTLNTFQETTGREVVVIIEACHSGTFVDNLTTGAKGPRLVITSSGEGISYLGTGGTPSFSAFMIDTLYKGGNFKNAFALAKTGLNDSGKPYTLQEPQMVEVNLTAEELFVVGDFALAPMFPEIPESEISVPATIALGSSVNISAKATGVSGGKVWATIKPVNYEPPAVSGDFVTPELKIPSVDLVDEKNLAFDDVFEGTYEGFKQGADYTTNGVYELVIYAQDMEQNVTKSSIHSITLTGGDDNAKPNAGFTFSPANPEPGEIVSFTDTSTDDGAIESWAWNFGDTETSTEQNPTHTYSAQGTYTATLMVTDDQGATGSYSKMISVGTVLSGTDLEIIQGWNLLSSDIAFSVTDKLSDDSKFASVWKWESGGWAVYLPGGGTQTYADSKGFSVLSTINPGEGFWVNSVGSETISIEGTPTTGSLTLTPGWNLVGLKSDQGVAVTTLISGNEANIASLWKWESGAWAVYLPGESDGGAAYAVSKGFTVLTSIEPGEGFWVNATQQITLD